MKKLVLPIALAGLMMTACGGEEKKEGEESNAEAPGEEKEHDGAAYEANVNAEFQQKLNGLVGSTWVITRQENGGKDEKDYSGKEIEFVSANALKFDGVEYTVKSEGDYFVATDKAGQVGPLGSYMGIGTMAGDSCLLMGQMNFYIRKK